MIKRKPVDTSMKLLNCVSIRNNSFAPEISPLHRHHHCALLVLPVEVEFISLQLLDHKLSTPSFLEVFIKHSPKGSWRWGCLYCGYEEIKHRSIQFRDEDELTRRHRGGQRGIEQPLVGQETQEQMHPAWMRSVPCHLLLCPQETRTPEGSPG